MPPRQVTDIEEELYNDDLKELALKGTAAGTAISKFAPNPVVSMPSGVVNTSLDIYDLYNDPSVWNTLNVASATTDYTDVLKGLSATIKGRVIPYGKFLDGGLKYGVGGVDALQDLGEFGKVFTDRFWFGSKANRRKKAEEIRELELAKWEPSKNDFKKDEVRAKEVYNPLQGGNPQEPIPEENPVFLNEDYGTTGIGLTKRTQEDADRENERLERIGSPYRVRYNPDKDAPYEFEQYKLGGTVKKRIIKHKRQPLTKREKSVVQAYAPGTGYMGIQPMAQDATRVVRNPVFEPQVVIPQVEAETSPSSSSSFFEEVKRKVKGAKETITEAVTEPKAFTKKKALELAQEYFTPDKLYTTVPPTSYPQKMVESVANILTNSEEGYNTVEELNEDLRLADRLDRGEKLTEKERERALKVKDRNQDMTGVDAALWAKYLGVTPHDETLVTPSKWKPQGAKEGEEYFAANISEDDKDTFIEEVLGNINPEDLKKGITMRTPITGYGRAKVKLGSDENGTFIEVNDRYDFKGSSGFGGTPYKIYDRYYFNPKDWANTMKSNVSYSKDQMKKYLDYYKKNGSFPEDFDEVRARIPLSKISTHLDEFITKEDRTNLPIEEKLELFRKEFYRQPNEEKFTEDDFNMEDLIIEGVKKIGSGMKEKLGFKTGGIVRRKKLGYGQMFTGNDQISELKARELQGQIDANNDPLVKGLQVGGTLGMMVGQGMMSIAGSGALNKQVSNNPNSSINPNYNNQIEPQFQFDEIDWDTMPQMAEGGEIHIKPENKGKFTASADRAGMGVQEYARHILANKDDYSSTLVKRANFARNAAKWKAMGGEVDELVPVEVEGDEVAELPQGEMVDFQGPTHEDGGIPVDLPQGTRVYSDRIQIDGKTMAQRKKLRESKIRKLKEKATKGDILAKNTLDRFMQTAAQEEQLDMSLQQAAASQMQKFNRGGIVRKKLLFGTDGAPAGYYYQYPNADLETGTWNPANRFTLGTDLDSAASYMDYVNSQNNPTSISNMEVPEVTPPGGEKEFNPNTASFISTADNNNNSNSNSKSNWISRNGMSILGALPTAGDVIGTLGMMRTQREKENAFNQGWANEFANPARNQFEDYGREGLKSLAEQQRFFDRQRGYQQRLLEGQRTLGNQRAVRSARSVNTQRALLEQSQANMNNSMLGVENQYAQNMANNLSGIATMQNQRDQAVMQGRTQADDQNRANRMSYMRGQQGMLDDRGRVIQTLGRNLNDIQERNFAANTLNDKYRNFGINPQTGLPYGKASDWINNGDPTLFMTAEDKAAYHKATPNQKKALVSKYTRG